MSGLSDVLSEINNNHSNTTTGTTTINKAGPNRSTKNDKINFNNFLR